MTAICKNRRHSGTFRLCAFAYAKWRKPVALTPGFHKRTKRVVLCWICLWTAGILFCRYLEQNWDDWGGGTAVQPLHNRTIIVSHLPIFQPSADARNVSFPGLSDTDLGPRFTQLSCPTYPFMFSVNPGPLRWPLGYGLPTFEGILAELPTLERYSKRFKGYLRLQRGLRDPVPADGWYTHEFVNFSPFWWTYIGKQVRPTSLLIVTVQCILLNLYSPHTHVILGSVLLLCRNVNAISSGFFFPMTTTCFRT